MKHTAVPVPELMLLPYQSGSESYFHTISANLPAALLLQSDSPSTWNNGEIAARKGRFDILTASPEYWLETRHEQTPSWNGNSPPSLSIENLNSLEALHALLNHIQKNAINFSQCIAEDIPFCGGLIGYCCYDIAREYIDLPGSPVDDINIPGMQFGFYTWACIQDHLKQKSWLVIHPDCSPILREKLYQLLTNVKPEKKIINTEQINEMLCNTTKKQYEDCFYKIKEYINSGDCYQVNFSRRFSAKTSLDSKDIYHKLRKIMPSPFCAFLPVLGQGTDDAIISLSPERFIGMDHEGNVVTQPIKGTAARGDNKEDDIAISKSLINDPKNIAENIMIVDLLRNDLGRVCKTGSIQVKELCELQSFSNVHHLVSTINGSLKEGLNGADLLKACFPGGSITGAPKIRAMEIIDELETTRRSIYCGSIVCFSSHGSMNSNITIRTILKSENTVYCWGGGGIVSDSQLESEYQESFIKVESILRAINQQ